MTSPRTSVASSFDDDDIQFDHIHRQTTGPQSPRHSSSSDESCPSRQESMGSVPVHNTFLNIISHPEPLFVKSLSMPEEFPKSEDPILLDASSSQISRQEDDTVYKPRRCRISDSKNALGCVPELESHETNRCEQQNR